MNNDYIPEMVTIDEASKRTGLSRFCLRNMILNNEITYFKTGKKYLINFNLLCKYLNGEGGVQ